MSYYAIYQVATGKYLSSFETNMPALYKTRGIAEGMRQRKVRHPDDYRVVEVQLTHMEPSV